MFEKIVILTGAGISAESGIRTFRDGNGLWEEHRLEDVATPEAFARNPELVHRFYNQRRKQLKDPSVRPNRAHEALAELERQWNGDFLLVTQNVDDLHERAGSRRLIHMHGALQKALCKSCEKSDNWSEDLNLLSTCKLCGSTGKLRPDIVWFGEMPYQMDEIFESLHSCDVFVSIGTSGHVYPAAGFVRQAWKARTIEINLERSILASEFKEHRSGPASIEVPKLVDELLSSIR